MIEAPRPKLFVSNHCNGRDDAHHALGTVSKHHSGRVSGPDLPTRRMPFENTDIADPFLPMS